MNRFAAVVVASLSAAFVAPVLGRTWSDTSGQYTVEADLAGYTDDSVILLRDDQHLAEIELDQLSETDRAFVASDEAKRSADKFSDHTQSWTTRGGVTIAGQVVDYISKEITLQRRRGKIYVNDRVFDNLPKVYQSIVPKIVAYFEKNEVSDKKSLESWLTHKRGAAVSYACDGVVIELENGDEYALPFFLLSDQDLELLRPGWDAWRGAAGNQTGRSDSSAKLQTLAAAYQQNNQAKRQVAQLQLAMQAVDAGVTSLWEVTLYPGPGVAGAPVWAVVPGRDSRVAASTALGKNPGYVVGPVRRVSN